jgi:hypothetical protein
MVRLTFGDAWPSKARQTLLLGILLPIQLGAEKFLALESMVEEIAQKRALDAPFRLELK